MQQFQRIGKNIASSLQRDAPTWLLLFSLSYCVLAVAGSTRSFWYDELFTYYLSRLPSLTDIWVALGEGVDLNPPLLYLATRASHSLLGVGPVPTRFPEIAS